MKKIITILNTILILSLFSCQTKEDVPENTEVAEVVSTLPTSDNSQNALDWEGEYKGVIPCADCAGIETSLMLNKDLTYQISMKYLGKSDIPIEYGGTFSWDVSGSKIILSGIPGATLMYLVGENKLFQLDQQGNRITGDLAPKYELAKTL